MRLMKTACILIYMIHVKKNWRTLDSSSVSQLWNLFGQVRFVWPWLSQKLQDKTLEWSRMTGSDLTQRCLKTSYRLSSNDVLRDNNARNLLTSLWVASRPSSESAPKPKPPFCCIASALCARIRWMDWGTVAQGKDLTWWR